VPQGRAGIASRRRAGQTEAASSPRDDLPSVPRAARPARPRGAIVDAVEASWRHAHRRCGAHPGQRRGMEFVQSASSSHPTPTMVLEIRVRRRSARRARRRRGWVRRVRAGSYLRSRRPRPSSPVNAAARPAAVVRGPRRVEMEPANPWSTEWRGATAAVIYRRPTRCRLRRASVGRRHDARIVAGICSSPHSRGGDPLATSRFAASSS